MIADELERLQQLHENGTLTDAEFAEAKASVLRREGVTASAVPPPSADISMQSHLKHVRLQNDLEQLDREWLMDREKYMSSTRRGGRQLPNRAGAIIGLVIGGGFSIFWTVMAFGITSFMPFNAVKIFPLFGLLFLVAIVWGSITEFRKAGAYEKAEQQYKERRAQLVSQQDRPV